MTTKTRKEHDLLGTKEISDSTYYGIQTKRALDNFDITNIPLYHFPDLVKSLAMVKKACALANNKTKLLDERLTEAICLACDDIINGNLHEYFVVDMLQGGAGTSTNMNINEVVANRALEILDSTKGNYELLHPNNHVNMSQSTNDVYPTAIRLAILLMLPSLLNAMQKLVNELEKKGNEFMDVIKMGRTQLQDAVPMTLGQEFHAFTSSIRNDIKRVTDASKLLSRINLGGTAIGTGLNASDNYRSYAISSLSIISGITFIEAHDMIEATYDTGCFVLFSGTLKRIAIKLSKICNDLRLLNSGPRAGFNEINLPATQPGSSIMPGKINPVIPELVNQSAYQVIGNDLTITLASEAGQLQLNVMEPVIALNLLQSTRILTRSINTLSTKCISGITANREVCREMVEKSIGIITILNPVLGYEKTSYVAQKALEENKTVRQVILEEKILTSEEVAKYLDYFNAAKIKPNTSNNQ